MLSPTIPEHTACIPSPRPAPGFVLTPDPARRLSEGLSRSDDVRVAFGLRSRPGPRQARGAVAHAFRCLPLSGAVTVHAQLSIPLGPWLPFTHLVLPAKPRLTEEDAEVQAGPPSCRSPQPDLRLAWPERRPAGDRRRTWHRLGVRRATAVRPRDEPENDRVPLSSHVIAPVMSTVAGFPLFCISHPLGRVRKLVSNLSPRSKARAAPHALRFWKERLSPAPLQARRPPPRGSPSAAPAPRFYFQLVELLRC